MAALKIFGRKPAQKKPIATRHDAQTSGGKTAVGMSQCILSPHITEKATVLAAKNQYVFIVAQRAYKGDIARAVEKMYGVNVKLVRIVNVHSKKMRLGRIQGIKKGYKKAMVKLEAGQKIDILPT